ncbi:response regulator transcription factor [Tomitella fengzijianii]|uniref:Response regulator transcription factor n=1 Tax=Tomitella fengzijianii TaxID=2597660 RepID=A0A516X5W9_9ACTN|nr:response regulator transcription factor [Tomitella fengzijianii]QDQ98467.1 response regulator transcription factor [Tomitella fengzijianii]
MTIRVAVVDDQQLVRAGFAMVIDSQPDMAVAWQAGDGREALGRLSADPVDIVIMDVQMPRLDGIEATRRALAADPAPRVIVLTTFDIDRYVLDAITAGASGFLLKDTDPEQLLASIRTVAGGDATLSARSTRRLLDHVRRGLGTGSTPEPALVEDLTAREAEFLRHMALGLNNGELAERLFVSEATVKTHVGRILAKTGSRDRVQAVLTAFRAGLVTAADLRG